MNKILQTNIELINNDLIISQIDLPTKVIKDGDKFESLCTISIIDLEK